MDGDIHSGGKASFTPAEDYYSNVFALFQSMQGIQQFVHYLEVNYVERRMSQRNTDEILRGFQVKALLADGGGHGSLPVYASINRSRGRLRYSSRKSLLAATIFRALKCAGAEARFI